MLLWPVLFILIIVISLILAYQSMKDFQEKPEKLGLEYGLFLIRDTFNFTPEVLNLIHQDIAKDGLVISIERLFKGLKSALVIYGPKDIILKHNNALRLIELEDYAQNTPANISVWEVGVKDLLTLKQDMPNLFKELPQLRDSEQFWWQLILQAKVSHPWDKALGLFKGSKEDFGPVNSHNLAAQRIAGTQGLIGGKNFQCHIRAAVLTDDPNRKVSLESKLEKFGTGKLVKYPQAFSGTQILEFYKGRTLPFMSSRPFLLTSEDILKVALKPVS